MAKFSAAPSSAANRAVTGPEGFQPTQWQRHPKVLAAIVLAAKPDSSRCFPLVLAPLQSTLIAMQAISTRASRGKRATCTAARAGLFSLKNSA